MLAGRDDLLSELDDHLTGYPSEAPRIIVLHGLGGAGKTSLALEYAYRHLADTGVVWLFPAADLALMTAEFARLAAQLGADVGPLDRRDPVATVHALLAASPSPWLLIFDDAQDLSAVAWFLPPAGPGQVLITSQSGLLPHDQSMEVPVLEKEVAADFLMTRTRDPDPVAATDLAVQLGGLPLALEQAAAYIQATGGTLAGYFAAFSERHADLLARGEPTGYGKTIATTWDLAFARLEGGKSEAVALLRLLACCAPEPVPFRLLLDQSRGVPGSDIGPDVGPVLRSLRADPLTSGDAIAELRRFSLLKPSGDGLVLMHRLVQRVTLAQMPRDLKKQWQQAAVVLIEAAMSVESVRPDTWPRFEVLLPHARAVLADDSDGMARVASYLRHRGDYQAARIVGEQVVAARRHSLGDRDLATLHAQLDLAFTLRALTEFDASRELLEQIIGPLGDALGDGHRTTLVARHSLALGYRDLGQREAAEAEFRAVLNLQRNSLGEEDTATLATRGGLASLLHRNEQYVQAEAEYRAVLEIQQRVLGERDRDTLSTRHALAYVLQTRGDSQTAEREYRAIIELQGELRGQEHPSTLGARHNLASALQDQGRWDEAEAEYRAVLEIRQRVLGDRRHDTLSTRSALEYLLQARTCPEDG